MSPPINENHSHGNVIISAQEAHDYKLLKKCTRSKYTPTVVHLSFLCRGEMAKAIAKAKQLPKQIQTEAINAERKNIYRKVGVEHGITA